MHSTWLSWSSGKDSAWSLHVLKNSVDYNVAGIFTTVNEKRDRVAMHSTRFEILQAQADALGLPLYVIKIPEPCTNEVYEAKMHEFMSKAKEKAVTHMAFGDLYLQDIRNYREKMLNNTGIKPVFPLWKKPTKSLALEMIGHGLKAIVTCVDTHQLPADFVGREYDEDFLNDLPKAVDPCGENGEFHTCVYAGPFFKTALNIETGEKHNHEQFCFMDVLLK